MGIYSNVQRDISSQNTVAVRSARVSLVSTVQDIALITTNLLFLQSSNWPKLGPVFLSVV